MNLLKIIFFNKYGNKISEELNSYENHFFVYDNNNYLLADTTYRNDNIFSVNLYKYDNSKNLSIKSIYSSDGSLEQKITYEYDKNDNMVKSYNHYYKKYNSNKEDNAYDDPLVSYYLYDRNKNLIFDSIGYVTIVFRREYRVNYYNYDIKGNLLNKKTRGASYSRFGHYSYKYDNFGNIVNEKYQSGFSDVSYSYSYSYSYTYDNLKNWIKKVSYENEFPNTITERKIEYYK